jgi:pumilio RNA-binding family
MDSIGNYFIQKVLDYINPENLIRFISVVATQFYSLAVNQYGTRVLQKLLDILSVDFKYQKIAAILFKQMEMCTLDLFMDCNSVYLIHKIVKVFPMSCGFIYECIYNNILTIATDRNGCCALQKCIEAGNPHQRDTIIKLLLSSLLLYITDQYANYAIQYITTLNDQMLLRRMIMCFKGNITYLAKQKYSSNVIEKVKLKLNLDF